MCSDGPKSLFGFEFLDIDFSGLWPNHRECSKTTLFETRLERSELIEPTRGIIRVTDETSDTKREHVVE